MSAAPEHDQTLWDDVPVDHLVVIDRACLAFERSCRAESIPPIEPLLQDVPDESCRRILLLELLKLECAYRRQQGETPQPSEYRARFVEYSAEVAAAFAALDAAPPSAAVDASVVCSSSRYDAPSVDLPPVDVASADSSATRRYEKLRPLAAGGLGEVHIALDRDLQRQVALKSIRADRRSSGEARERFLREARITGRLEHPGIVPVYGLAYDEQGLPTYAMRLVDGETLENAIRTFHASAAARGGRLELSVEFRRLLAQLVTVCHTIEYAHSRQVVHRDLKPANIMLGAHGETLVVDWGTAKVCDEQSAPAAAPADHAFPMLAPYATCDGLVLGTPAYMSPEQAAGRSDAVGPASDVYALGAILFALLTGRAPIEGSSSGEILDKARNAAARSPRDVQRRVPPALNAICQRAMSEQPSQRYPSAAALAEELERWLAGGPVRAWPEPMLRRCGRWCSQHRAAVTALVATLLACAAVVLGARWWTARARHHQSIDSLIGRMETAELRAMPALLNEWRTYGREANEPLRARLRDSGAERQPHNLLLALLPTEPRCLPALGAHLLTCPLSDFVTLRDLLRSHGDQLAPQLWQHWEQQSEERSRTLRLAAALAAYDPQAPNWEQHFDEVAQLVALESPLELKTWVDAFRPLSAELRPALLRIFHENPGSSEGEVASTVLASYAEGDLELLLELLRSAEPRQLAPLVRQLKTLASTARPELERMLENLEPPPPRRGRTADVLEPLMELSRVRGRLLIALFFLGDHERVWPLLAANTDPTLTSQLIHLFAGAQVDPQILIDRWRQSHRADERRAILLVLGTYHPSSLARGARSDLIAQIADAYRYDPDSGLHSATAWLLQRWGEGDLLRTLQAEVQTNGGPSPERRWYVNSQGQTFAVVSGPVTFHMGSPASETTRSTEEYLHLRRIDRSFAMMTHEVSVEEFAALAEKESHPTLATQYAPDPNCPAVFVRWFQAARYCRRLSELERIPEDQQCFPSVEAIGPDMVLPPDYLFRHGYRLPTAAEWELACRAGTVSRASFGNDVRLAPYYAWGVGDDAVSSHPVGQLKPNALGMFDMLGNVAEWTIDIFRDARQRPDWGPVVKDDFVSAVVDQGLRRDARGGHFAMTRDALRSAQGTLEPPSGEVATLGFRLARTLEPHEVPLYFHRDDPLEMARATYGTNSRSRRLEIVDLVGAVEAELAPGRQGMRLEVRPKAEGALPFAVTVRDPESGQSCRVTGTLFHLKWTVKYYRMRNQQKPKNGPQVAQFFLHKTPLAVEQHSELAWNWGSAAPLPDGPEDHFVIRAATKFHVPAGHYVVYCDADDGLFVAIDQKSVTGNVVMRGFHGEEHIVPLDEGEHRMDVVYYDWDGPARLNVRIQPVDVVQ